jgi:hypothetical protein
MSNHMNDAIEEFMELFQGRTDAYGTWEGGSVKEPTNYKSFARHLYDEELIGIYPLKDDSTVRWGCSDIDVDEIDLARNLQLALQSQGIPAFIEKTVRGYHIWVFASEWVPAPIMRRAFLAAHEAINLVAKEVNPKQEQAKDVGNYVRLPYPGAMATPPANRYMIDDADMPIELGTFLAEALDNRVTANMLRPLAEKHRPRAKATMENLDVSASVEEALRHCSRHIKAIWYGGPLPNQDRSNTLCMLAHRMCDYNVPMNLAYIVLVDADKRWGKFHLREDCVEQLVKIIEDTYGEFTTGAFRA